MSEEWYIIGGILCILLVILIVRKHKKTKDQANAPAGIVSTPAKAVAPPPLPPRRAPALPPRYPTARALDYPKCPLDRSRNQPGKPQVVFWDSTHNCYTCSHGHRFTGRE